MSQLGPEDLVVVTLPATFGRRRDDVAHFHVLAVIGSIVALEPLTHADIRALPDMNRECFMTFGDGRAVVGLKGHLYKHAPGDWRFKITDRFADRQAAGRSRIRFCAPLTIAPDGDATDAPRSTQTVNIGPDGVLVDGGTDWSAPQQAQLTMSLPGYDDPIRAPVRLVARQGALYDYQYEKMDPAARRLLYSFIIECQRARLSQRKQRWRAELLGLDSEVAF